MQLLFVGDIMLGRLVNDWLREHDDPLYPWGDTLSVFQRADWCFGNLECAISDRGEPWRETPKTFHFRADAKNIAALQAADLDAVSLANNHALDYGYDALHDTTRILGEVGIEHAGAGANRLEAAALAGTEIDGLTIGVIAFTDNQPEWEADTEKAGVFYVPANIDDSRAKALFNHIRRARDGVDLLIVSAHWGPNWGVRPPSGQQPFAHQLIDAGADMIFGHSGHIFRGIEWYQGKPIVYSAGDFIDDYAVDPIERNDWSFIYIADYEDGRIQRLRLYPTIIYRFQARMAHGADQSEIVRRMISRCARLETAAVWHETEEYLEVAPT